MDRTTNLLKSVSMNGITLNVEQHFLYYNSTIRKLSSKINLHDDESQTVSGAYMFRPNRTAIHLNGTVSNKYIFRGNNVQEFHQTWSTSLMDILQVIRVYRGQDYIEFDWIVGNIT